MREFAQLLQKYVEIEYNCDLLYQGLSLSSIDMNLHQNIARVHFIGDQIIKYCTSIEAYMSRKAFSEVELTRFVHHTVSNKNLVDCSKQKGYLQYLIVKHFDKKTYEISQFASATRSFSNGSNSYDRIREALVSRKAMADMIEALVAITFYNDSIVKACNDKINNNNDQNKNKQYFSMPLGNIDFKELNEFGNRIGNMNSIRRCRALISHLLNFKYFEPNVTFPDLSRSLISIKAMQQIWGDNVQYQPVLDDKMIHILDILDKICEDMKETSAESSKSQSQSKSTDTNANESKTDEEDDDNIKESSGSLIDEKSTESTDSILGNVNEKLAEHKRMIDLIHSKSKQPKAKTKTNGQQRKWKRKSHKKAVVNVIDKGGGGKPGTKIEIPNGVNTRKLSGVLFKRNTLSTADLSELDKLMSDASGGQDYSIENPTQLVSKWLDIFKGM